MKDKFVWSDKDVELEDSEAEAEAEELDASAVSEEEMLSWFTPGGWEGIVYEDDDEDETA